MGLTSVTIGLVRALDRVGLRVHFFKPIGQPHAGDAGPERSTGILRQTMRLNPPVPIALGRAEQLMSEGNQDILMEEVVGLFQQTAADADVVIVEGLVHTPQATLRRPTEHAYCRELGCRSDFGGRAGAQ
ncbi:MAG: AAA family ATPase [Chloroflexi bacterium]|nr:AAA family ATPase [Chloroflexota bacterium]